MPTTNKYHLTQSLLSDFARIFTSEDGYEGFIKSLNRQPKPLSEAMAKGIEFESCVNSALDGEHIPSGLFPKMIIRFLNVLNAIMWYLENQTSALTVALT